MHAVAPVFEAGAVWAPNERWAEEMIEECAMFPHAEHDLDRDWETNLT